MEAEDRCAVYAAGMSDSLTDYEREQWQRIERWRLRAPPAASRGLSRASGPASRALQKLVPDGVLRSAMDLLQSAAERSANRSQILRMAAVTDIAELRSRELEDCDRLAQRVRRQGALIGGGAGAALGLAGGIGLALDMPTLLIVCLRTIHRTGLCYGEDCADRRDLPLAIFALASANTREEKQYALDALDRGWEGDADALREGVERSAQRELAKEAMQIGLHRLSLQLARRLGWRLGAGALPVIGAAIGGGVNAWFLNEVAVAASYTFQWRRLREHIAALPAESGVQE
jgi:hypothetical protein